MGPLRTLISTSCLVALTLLGPVAGQQLPEPERYSAFAISLGGPVTAPGTAQVELAVTRWSPPEDLDRLLAAMKDTQRAVAETLRDFEPAGTIRTPASLSYDLRYASQEAVEGGGRQIILLTDRPISQAEVMRQSRSLDYPITLIELNVDANGEGEGKLYTATRLYTNETRGLFVRQYASNPVMLKELRRRK
jgi:hypothetical protein